MQYIIAFSIPDKPKNPDKRCRQCQHCEPNYNHTPLEAYGIELHGYGTYCNIHNTPIIDHGIAAFCNNFYDKEEA